MTTVSQSEQTTKAPYLSTLVRSEAKTLIAGCLLLVVVYILWYADILLPLPRAWRRYIVHGDFTNQFYPFQHFAAEEWWSGRVPLWNPYAYGGHPFQADPQSAVFYIPGLAINLVAGRHGLPFVALEWRAAIAYMMAACFTYLFVQRVCSGHVAGLIAALVFAGGGFLTSYPLQQLPVLEAAIWLPFSLYGFERAVERRGCNPRWGAVAGGALGMSFLAGHTQTTMFEGYVMAAYFLFRCVQTKQPWKRVVFCAAVSVAVFLGLALPQLLPTWQFTELSNRGALSYAEAGGGYELKDLPELLSPKGLFQRGYYVGIAPLVLLLVGWRRPSGQTIFWTIVAAVGVLLAMGKYGPLYPIAYHLLPAYSLFKDQERAALLWTFAAAVLAGVGWRDGRLRKDSELASIVSGLPAVPAPVSSATSRSSAEIASKRPTRDRLFVATRSLPVTVTAWGVALVAAVGVSSALWLQPVTVDNPASSLPPQVASILALALCVATMVALFAERLRTVPSAVASLVMLLLVGAPLYGANAGNNRSDTPTTPGAAVVDVLSYAKRQPGLFRLWELQDIFPSNLGAIEHVAFPIGDSPIYLRRVRTLLETRLQYRLSQLFNVQYLIASTDDGGPGVELVHTDDNLRLFKRRYALPRAWAVRDVRVAHDDQEELDLTLHVPEPGATAVLPHAPTLPINGPDLPRDQKETWTRYEPTVRELSVMVTDNSLLVISEPSYPGWEATVDGRPAPILRADYAFQALELTAGTHIIRLEYRPIALIQGAVAGAALLLAAIMAMTIDTRRRCDEKTA